MSHKRERLEARTNVTPQGIILVEFPVPVVKFELTPSLARAMAHQLWELAREADRCHPKADLGPCDPVYEDQDPLDRPSQDG
jgi:hypothetical protein